jgi:enoyl-CoA hydratase/carnithine racemase
MSGDPLVLAETADAVATISINRPAARNALDPLLIEALARAFERADADPAVHVVLLQAEGSHFCAGLDLKTNWPSTIAALVQSGIGGREAPFALRKPLVAAIQGVALGAGFELALAADLILVDESARFALPEFDFGSLPVTGALSRLTARIGASRTAEVLLTGRSISAADAVDWGLAQMAATSDLRHCALELAGRIASQPLHLCLLAKQALAAAQTDSGRVVERQLAFAAFSARREIL